MHQLIQQYTAQFKKKNVPDPRPGDTIRVYQKIREAGKERIQMFEGLCIKRSHGQEIGATFTLRKIAVDGIGVERTFPLHSPTIIKVERVKSAKVRRAKLLYLRDLVGKMKLKGEKRAHQLWEEPEAEKELEVIEKQKALEAAQKEAERAKAEAELEKKAEAALKKHKQVEAS